MSERKKKEKKPKSKARSIVEWVITIVFGLGFLAAAVIQFDGFLHRESYYDQTVNFSFGWATMSVLTDSMADVYPVNSAIFVHKEDAKAIFDECTIALATNGEKYVDLTFKNGQEYINEYPTNPQYRVPVHTQEIFTHRVIEVKEDPSIAVGEGRYLFFMAGTNKEAKAWDPSQFQVITEKSILGVVRGNSKVLGGFFQILASPWGLLIFLLVPAGYLVVVSVLDIFKAMKEPGEETAGGDGGEPKFTNVDDPDNPLAGLSEEDKKRLKEELLQKMLDERMNGGEGK